MLPDRQEISTSYQGKAIRGPGQQQKSTPSTHTGPYGAGSSSEHKNPGRHGGGQDPSARDSSSQLCDESCSRKVHVGIFTHLSAGAPVGVPATHVRIKAPQSGAKTETWGSGEVCDQVLVGVFEPLGDDINNFRTFR